MEPVLQHATPSRSDSARETALRSLNACATWFLIVGCIVCCVSLFGIMAGSPLAGLLGLLTFFFIGIAGFTLSKHWRAIRYERPGAVSAACRHVERVKTIVYILTVAYVVSLALGLPSDCFVTNLGICAIALRTASSQLQRLEKEQAAQPLATPATPS